MPPTPPNRPRRQHGVALVIVLAFVVLLTGVTVAFFSRAVAERQVSNSSANEAKVGLLAQGALDSIVSDLKQEIVAGSTAAVVSTNPTVTLYTPTVLANAAPARTETSTDAGLANLIKRSVYGQPFYPSTNYTGASINRAAGPAALSSTQVPSANGRSISVARWNKPLLLGKKTPSSSTDFTPIDPFVAPNWILLARDGSNPTVWNANMVTSPNNATSVVGRYAYTIYNEGGLLDMNVAGAPSNTTTAQSSRKNALGLADLTQLQDAAGNPVLTQAQIDAVVGWRNYASSSVSTAALGGQFPNYTWTAANATSLYNSILSNNLGFNATSRVPLANGQSDRLFSSRQELISLLGQLGSNSGNLAAAQNGLQYLGTFSRSLNQPSYSPNPNRPKIVSAASSDGPSYGGGNSGYGYDDSFNPSFRTIRVKTAFTRFDGTPAQVGEPLAKKRFALSRLAWITHNGPSANNLNDAAVQASIKALGGKNDPNDPIYKYVALGTAANIGNCFNLKWNPDTGNGGYWTYNYRSSPTAPGSIATLAQVAGVNREPDFFELLKASLCAGSLAKGVYTLGYFSRILAADTSVNYQIMQIGANIIDAADADSFPTQLVFNDGVTNNSFWGQEDLPYLFSTAQVSVMARPPVPPAPANAAAQPGVALVDPGSTATLVVPVVWNPYSASDLAQSSVLQPTQLRVSMTLVPTQGYGSGADYQQYRASPESKIQYGVRPALDGGSYDPTTGAVINLAPATGPANSAIYFNNGAPATTLYREPTPLWIPGGSANISIDPNHSLVRSGGYTIAGIPEAGSGLKYVGFFTGNDVVRWVDSSDATRPLYTNNGVICSAPTQPITFCLEYLDPSSGHWVSYQQYGVGDEVFSSNLGPNPFCKLWYQQGDANNNALSQWSQYTTNQSVSWDARTPRWGIMWDAALYNFQDAAKTIVPTTKLGAAVNLNASHGTPRSAGWLNSTGNAGCPMGQVAQNIFPGGNPSLYYADADGVVRRAMAGMVTSTGSTTGLPLASTYNQSANVPNRPVMLNRPFQSVAELGYVFSGTPWKNLDFSFPESGDSALLDVFAVNDDITADALAAGKVDLNTRQIPVLQAILAGACRNETPSSDPAATTLAGGANGEARKLATALVTRTTTGPAGGTGAQPLANLADLVGRYTGTAVAANNNQPYDGFAADLIPPNYDGGTVSNNATLQRYRESAMRALANTGQAGTWNLLIDVVAQIGRYPLSAQAGGDVSRFVVEGEKRYWLHVAIDRQTGKVIDQQFEPVNE